MTPTEFVQDFSLTRGFLHVALFTAEEKGLLKPADVYISGRVNGRIFLEPKTGLIVAQLDAKKGGVYNLKFTWAEIQRHIPFLRQTISRHAA